MKAKLLVRINQSYVPKAATDDSTGRYGKSRPVMTSQSPLIFPQLLTRVNRAFSSCINLCFCVRIVNSPGRASSMKTLARQYMLMNVIERAKG